MPSDFEKDQVSDGRRLTFNEFQKLLRNRGVDEKIAYFLTLMYEQMSDQAQQLNETLTIVNALASNLIQFSNLRIADAQVLRSLQKRLEGGDGVSVASVANESEKH